MKKTAVIAALLASVAWPALADSTINNLSAGAALTGTEQIPMFQTANPAVTTTPNAIKAYVGTLQDNRILNGDFMIDQRNGGAVNTLANAAYWGENWLFQTDQGADLTAQRLSTGGPTAFTFIETFTVTNAFASPGAGNFLFTAHDIEGTNIADFLWGTSNAKSVVVSMWLKASVAGTYGFMLVNGAANRNYGFTCALASATWTLCSNVIPGDTSGTWVTTTALGLRLRIDFGSGSSFLGAAGAWQAGNLSGVTGSTSLVATNAATLSVTNIRLYPATAAIPNEPKTVQQVTLEAQRYFQTSFPIGTVPAQNAGVGGAHCMRNPIANGQPSTYVQFNPPMRATPTITTYNPSAANANIRNVTAAADVTVAVDPATAVGTSGVEIAAGATVATIAQTLCIHWVADAAP